MSRRGPHLRPGGRRGMAAARWLLTLAFLSAVTLAAILLRARSAGPEAGSPPRPDLNRWSLLGCYELVVDRWEEDRLVSLSESEAARDPWQAAPLRFPEAIMLQPDSLDEWRRPLGDYRVVALPPAEASAARTGDRSAAEGVAPVSIAGPLRWHTRADTLWILGSAPGLRAGIALFDTGDSLTGQARLVARAGSRSATAGARAWPINCATRSRETSRGRPRP